MDRWKSVNEVIVVIKVLSETEQMDEIIKNHPLVLLQIGSSQCAPCHAISQRLEQWNKKNSNVEIRYVPLEKYPEMTAQMGIYSVPTILTYVEGKLFQRESGYFSLDQLLDRFTDIIDENFSK